MNKFLNILFLTVYILSVGFSIYIIASQSYSKYLYFLILTGLETILIAVCLIFMRRKQ